MDRVHILAIGILLLGSVAACQSHEGGPETTRNEPHAVAEEQGQEETTYRAVGVVRSVTPSGSHVFIQHEDIPGFMDAMTMAFGVDDSVSVDTLKRDDRIQFEFVSGAQGTVIKTIEPL